jgi:hypothetical protein
MNQQNQNAERDIRLRMLNGFLSCPHRDTDQLKAAHLEVQQADPEFYAHLAAWYFMNGDIRDHKEVFIGSLACDPYIENREVGLALLRQVPVFLKRRVVGFIKGKKIKLREKTGKKIKRGKKMVDEVNITEKTVGLHKNVPTSFKRDIREYLKWLEEDNDRFDSVALRNSNDLKGLYATFKIPHSERVQDILFKKKYPEDSKLTVFEEITKAKTPEVAAKLIVENKIPYTIAVGLVDKITPSILVALINAMSPQEVINNIASLEEKGAMDNPDTKKLVDIKLEAAKTNKGVSALKSKTAQKTGRIKNEETAKKLDEIADVQIKKSGAITASTAVFVDKSGSMIRCIEVGKNVSAMISGATEASLTVVAFDTIAREVKATEMTLTGWEKAFHPIRAHGGTSIGIALHYLIHKNTIVEQIVIITDEDENNSPRFVDMYKEYVAKFNVKPQIVILRINEGYQLNPRLSHSLTQANVEFDLYEPQGGDYYGLPGLITLLSRKSNLDLLYEIMDTPLPTRQAFIGKKKKKKECSVA